MKKMHCPSRAASSIGMRSHLLTDIRISSGGMDNSGRKGTDAKEPHAPRPFLPVYILQGWPDS